MTSSFAPSPQGLARLARALNARHAPGWPACVLVTDETREPDPSRAIEQLPGNSAVLLRHYDAPHRTVRIEAWAKLARDHGHEVWVARDAILAKRVKANGVHLPEAMSHFAQPVRRLFPDLRISQAAHSHAAILAAARNGADAVFISPVFPTASHPGTRTLGPTRLLGLAQTATRHGLKAYALGGVTDKTATRLRNAPLAGLAAIEGLSPQPPQT